MLLVVCEILVLDWNLYLLRMFLGETKVIFMATTKLREVHKEKLYASMVWQNKHQFLVRRIGMNTDTSSGTEIT